MSTPDAPLPVELDHKRRRFRRANFIIGLVIVATVILTAILSAFWTPYDPSAISPSEVLLPTGSPGHILGTDQFGRDVFSQIMVGSQNALFVGVLAVMIAIVIGIPLGGLAAAKTPAGKATRMVIVMAMKASGRVTFSLSTI